MRKPSLSGHAGGGEQASPPAFPTVGPFSRRDEGTPRFPSTSPAGLGEMLRTAVCQGIVRPSRSPEWSARGVSRAGEPDCSAVGGNGKARHLKAMREFPTLPFDGTHRGGRLCPHISIPRDDQQEI